MPEKLERCVERVKKQGKSESSAWAICQASLYPKGERWSRKSVPEGVDKEKFDRCVEEVKEQGGVDNPYAVCMAQLTGQTEKSVDDVIVAQILEEVDFTKAADASQAKRVSGGVEYRGTKFPGFNKPRKSTKSEKKKMVLAKKGDKIKVVHYGATGYRHNYSPEAKRSFRARHKCDQQKDKFSAAYWACRDLWPTGSAKKATEMKGEDPCWEGYEMVGTKIKDGKEVPNCVPKSDSKKSADEYTLHDEPKDILIAVPVPLSIAEKLKVKDGIDPANMHITLAYLDTLSIDFDRVREILSSLSQILPSFSAKISGIGRFDHDDDVDVMYASVDAPLLNQIQNRIFNEIMMECGIVPNMEHGFNPHITLKYIDKEEDVINLEQDALQEWNASHIELWVGNVRFRYSLTK